MNHAAGESHEQHSHLVNLFAWTNIVLGIAGVLVLLLLMLVFRNGGAADQLLASLPELQQQASQAAAAAPHLSRAVLAASLALNVVLVYASYALLKRRNWARLFWVAALSLTVVWCIAGLFSPTDVSQLLPSDLNQAPPEMQEQIRALLPLVQASAYLISLALAALCAWLAWRFCAPDIRREFQAK